MDNHADRDRTEMKLSDQWVLVTGGARGLGAAIARALAREGAGVIINYRRSEAQAVSLASELGPGALAMQADVTDPAEVARRSWKRPASRLSRS
jgi:3-oxoacyl-[acyl-carrier protein] reductase